MRRRLTTALVAGASLTLIAGCSGSDSDSNSSGVTTTTASSGVTSTTTSAGETSTTSAGETTTSSSSDAEGRDVVDDPPAKSWEDALDAARDEFSGDVSKIELESNEDDQLEYKIELTSDDTSYAVQYDAETLDKVSEDSDDLGDDAKEKLEETFDPTDVIDLGEAASTARQEQDGTITKWKIEGKDTGEVQYEFDIRPAGDSDDVEVQIDATDGSVIQDS